MDAAGQCKQAFHQSLRRYFSQQITLINKLGSYAFQRYLSTPFLCLAAEKMDDLFLIYEDRNFSREFIPIAILHLVTLHHIILKKISSDYLHYISG